MSKLIFTYHALAFFHHVCMLKIGKFDVPYHQSEDPRIVEMEEFGPRYLTIWNILVQTLFLFMAMCEDWVRLHPNKKRFEIIADQLAKVKGYLYTVIIFPTTLVVSLFFWILFHIDRDFVLPETFEQIAPFWLNHGMHTNILVVIVAELFIAKKGLPRPKFVIAALASSGFALVYLVQFFVAYWQFGRWLYGIFYHLSCAQMAGLFLCQHAAYLLFLRMGFLLQDKLHTSHPHLKAN
ncbi:PREDICTED: androgen-dependent TFPI-regulating protein-like [Nicrophorus vespilloides]|uniref:Androgen-dependent TFPI-regulating protein-like n=1 Tax=Nicrophorus vespilloides TaxID=110193 RepID=A0ABM1NB07_NICVS|nr:PREDICTED: androgen-dependent TFPI-regulating protein-like [Nicrophorus vespilloides]